MSVNAVITITISLRRNTFRNGAVKALYWTGNQSALAASNWIFDQVSFALIFFTVRWHKGRHGHLESARCIQSLDFIVIFSRLKQREKRESEKEKEERRSCLMAE